MTDNRYITIKGRFELLSKVEIQRILDNVDIMCFDTHNFDEENNKYCPLAIAMNLHETIKHPTDHLIKNEIAKRFNPVNVIKGIDGMFYREDRKEDIIKICKEILENEFYSSRC